MTSAEDDAATAKRPCFTARGVRRGAVDILPITAFVFPFGVAFGVAASAKALPPGIAAYMSAAVFAGASQFAALDLWIAPLPLAMLAVTVLAVNARHILLGAALAPWLLQVPIARRLAALLVLSDSNFALRDVRPWAWRARRRHSARQRTGAVDRLDRRNRARIVWRSIAAILLMALVTAGTRVAGVWIMSYVVISPRIEAFLKYMAASVLISIVVPATLAATPRMWLAVGAAALVMIATRSALGAMIAGAVMAALGRALGV